MSCYYKFSLNRQNEHSRHKTDMVLNQSYFSTPSHAVMHQVIQHNDSMT